MSTSRYCLLAPGPVNLHPEVLKTLALPMIHHRSEEFVEIMKDVLDRLKLVVGTEQPVILHNSSGSGGMESLIVNTLSPGDRVLFVVSGKFGERWAQMGRDFGLIVDVLAVPWGESVTPDQIDQYLNSHADCRAVLTQACETSTGAWHPVREIGALVKERPHCLFLVDAITAMGALPLPFDEWHIDGIVGGSQKAFMLPAGLSIIALSEKGWKASEASRLPKYYFDLAKERRANTKGWTRFSGNVTLVRALATVLDIFLERGLPHLYKSIERRAEAVRWLARELGLSPVARVSCPSVTVLQVPAGMDADQLRRQMLDEFGVMLAGGQNELKGRVIRVGHMGYIEDEHLIMFADAFISVLHPNEDTFRKDKLQKFRDWLLNYSLNDPTTPEKIDRTA